jgi:hypothetical protein
MDDFKRLQAELEKHKFKTEQLEARVNELSDFVEDASIPLHWVDESGIRMTNYKRRLQRNFISAFKFRQIKHNYC